MRSERSTIALALAILMAAFMTWPAGATQSRTPDTRDLANWAPMPSEAPDVEAASPGTIDPGYFAIAAARAKLGKPYRWAGAGPNTFDCSGLTQFAYRTAGIELPHNSRAQYAATARVSLDEIRPGDLVFSGSGRIGHVGLYIGDGMMIHSPQSGETVKISPLRRNLIGAGRPVA